MEISVGIGGALYMGVSDDAVTPSEFFSGSLLSYAVFGC